MTLSFLIISMRFARKASKELVFILLLSLACMFLAQYTSVIHQVLENCIQKEW